MINSRASWKAIENPLGSSGLQTVLLSELIHKTRSVLGQDVDVAVEIVKEIPRTSQGKFRKFISEPVSGF